MEEIEYKPVTKYKVTYTKTTHIPGAKAIEEINCGTIPSSKINTSFLKPTGSHIIEHKKVGNVTVFMFRKDLPFFGHEMIYIEAIPIIETVEEIKPQPNLKNLKFSLSFYGITLGSL